MGGQRLPETPSIFKKLIFVAVGIPVARHPPHRSQRAAFPHWAPASGRNVQALLSTLLSIFGCKTAELD
jgi:hypothetical protein